MTFKLYRYTIKVPRKYNDSSICLKTSFTMSFFCFYHLRKELIIVFEHQPELKELNQKQLNVFIWIYQQIIADQVLTRSNREIAKRVNIPESTLEKYLKRFEELGLIIRDSERAINPLTMNWETTSRTIKLNPKKFDPMVLAKLRSAGIEAILNQLTVSEQTQAVIDQMYNRRSLTKENA